MSKTPLEDQRWRLNNLYWVVDETGNAVPFQMRWHQEEALAELSERNLVLKARRLGSTTFWAIFALDCALFGENLTIGLVADSKENAGKILADKIKFAYERLPEDLKAARPITKDAAGEISFGGTNSRIRVGVTFVGGTAQLMIVTEYGVTCSKNPSRAREIQKGFEAVDKDCVLVVESTARGKGGHFHSLCDRATKGGGRWGLRFFPWYKEPKHTLDPSGITFTTSELQYFTELKVKHGIELNDWQRAWYADKLREMGIDDMRQEYPSTPDEPFMVSLQGAYYAEQMLTLHQQGRIGSVPPDPSLLVETWWDLGLNDSTAIWFVQWDALGCRLINYYEASGESYAHYANQLRDFARETGIRYGKHYAPHDGAHRQQGVNSVKRRMDLASEVGLQWTIVPRSSDLLTDIEQVRRHLSKCWFDEARCAKGIEHLERYRKEWDERRGCYRDQPFHDSASHGADSFRTGVMAASKKAAAVTARPVEKTGRWAA